MTFASKDRFTNSRSRLERAEYHAKAFHSQWETFLEKDGLAAVGSYDKSSGWFVASVDPTPAMLEKIRTNTLSLELGEMAYQLRSALDGLIWETVTIMQAGSEPAPDADGANKLDFPILNGKYRDFKKCGFHKFPFPDQLREWLESIQPDSAEKPVGDPYRGIKTTLEDIHDLARHDRHRRLRVVGAAPTEIRFGMESSDPTARVGDYEMIGECDFLSGKHEFLRFKVITASGIFPEKVRLGTNVRVEISVEQIELYNGQNLGMQLQRFIQAVSMVIEKFEELVP